MLTVSLVVLLTGVCLAQPMVNDTLNTEPGRGPGAGDSNGTVTDGQGILNMLINITQTDGEEPGMNAEGGFESSPKTTTTSTTTATETSSRAEVTEQAPTPGHCSGFRPGKEPNQFQEIYRGEWFNKTCLAALVWSQEECNCASPPYIPEDPKCPGYRAQKGFPSRFEQIAHGIWYSLPCGIGNLWSQAECRCVRDPVPNRILSENPLPCPPIFNASFTNSFEDSGPNSYTIGIPVDGSVILQTTSLPEGAVDGVARVNRGQITLWFTGSNDMGSTLQITLRFKVSRGSNGNVEILSSPGCTGGPRTLSIDYRPSRKMFTVFFTDGRALAVLSCPAGDTDAYAFRTFDLIYMNKILAGFVDGKQCFRTDRFKRNLLPTPCYMKVGGRNFVGYVDQITFRKACVYLKELEITGNRPTII